VLELVYHTAVFGPIHFEYSGPVVRVGSSEDNDLVLRHPSVQPHHCLLVFRDEKVLCLPPGSVISSQVDWWELTGPEFSAGDYIQIGELQLSLSHSARSVAIPEAQSLNAGAGAVACDLAVEASAGPGPQGYFCTHCRVFIPEAEVNRVGLVGHAKRYLCPKCSSLLDSEPEPPRPASRLRRR
jgi:hypothetical protein